MTFPAQNCYWCCILIINQKHGISHTCILKISYIQCKLSTLQKNMKWKDDIWVWQLMCTHHIMWTSKAGSGKPAHPQSLARAFAVCPCNIILSCNMTKPTKWVCIQRRHPSVWSESSLSAWRNIGSLATHRVHSEDWSDWADAQADLSLGWAHTHFVGFIMSQLLYYRRLG